MTVEEIIARQPEELKQPLQQMFKNFPEDGFLMLRNFKKGTIFIEEGAPSIVVYILLKGTVETFWNQPGHGQYTAIHNSSLDFLGDLAPLCDYIYCTASMRTLTNCAFITMRRTVFMQWMQRDPEMHRILATKNLKMLARQGNDIRNAAMLPNDLRILEYLIWYCEINRESNAHDVRIKKTREQMVEDIGGVSLRTLNRYLSQMEEENLFSIVKGKIQISQKQEEKIRQIVTKRKEY